MIALTPAQAAESLQVSREIIYRLLNNKTIRAAKVGGQWRIHQRALDDLIYNESAGMPSEKERICLTDEKKAGIGGSLSKEYDNLLKLRTSRTQKPSKAA